MPAYSVRLSIWIVAAVLVLFGILFLLLYSPIKRFLMKTHTVRMYYHRIKRVVEDRDFLLINDFENKTAAQEPFHIDHLIIGNKFFYAIRDRYYDGALAAKETDNSWVFYHGRQSKLIANPMLRNELRVEKLCLLSRIQEQEIISIVLINDDCMITSIESSNPNSFIVSLKQLPALIDIIEAREGVQPIDAKSAEIIARDFAELNLHGKI